MSSSTKFRFYLFHFSLLCLFPFWYDFRECGTQKNRVFRLYPIKWLQIFGSWVFKNPPWHMIYLIENPNSKRLPANHADGGNNPSMKILLKPRVFTTTNGRNFKRAPTDSNRKARTDCKLALTVILRNTTFGSSNRNDENQTPFRQTNHIPSFISVLSVN